MTTESHAYLGALESVAHHRQSLIPEGQVVTMPLIFLPDVVRACCSSW